MSLFTKLGNDIASPVDAAGNKRSVDNGDMQVWMTEVERLSAAKAMGAITFGLLSEANSSLGYAPWTTAWIINDPVPANNGWYTKTGASGSGFWVRLGDLPYSYIRSANSGAGSANAIVATTTVPIPVVDGGALISLNITATNTGAPVTVSFNSGAALTIKTNTGADPAVGGLTAGMVVAGYKAGSEFRLLSDQASMAIIAAAEAAADRAEAAALSVVSRAWFKTVPDLVADNNEVIGYAGSGADFEVVAGDMVDAQGFRAEVAASDEADPDLTTAALVNLFVKPTQHGFVNPEQLGLIGAGGNDHPKIQRALDSGYPVVIPPAYYKIEEPLVMARPGQRLVGYDRNACLIYSNSETPHDVLRVFGTQAEVSGLWLRGTMSTATSRDDQTAVVRVLGGHVKVRGNRILSNTTGHGVGILIDDVDPDTLDPLGGGRYFHTVDDNWIGNYTSGFFYAGIKSFMWQIGLHATSILNNHIITDRAIVLEGAPGPGANSGQRVAFNTIQSATGTISAKAGIGVDIGAPSGHEVVFGNYIELFTSGVYFRRSDDVSGLTLGAVAHNTYDNCTIDVGSAGARRYVEQNFRTFMDWWNGWNTRYGNSAYVDFFAPGGTTSIRRVHADGAHAMQMVASREKQAAALTGNDQVITPTSSQIAINGGGANRTGITIANGIHEGQELTITANTWGATIDNDGGTSGNQNIYFAGNAASCVMGNSATNVAMLKLKWVTAFIGANGAWVEQSRLVRP